MGLDLAIMQITDHAFSGGPPVGFASIDRGSPDTVDACWAVGFPRFKERARGPDDRPLRDAAHVHGSIAPGANRISGSLELSVTATPRALPTTRVSESEWAGISGAVVFAKVAPHGDLAVGVVTEHSLPEGESVLTVVPITAVNTLEDGAHWWELLSVRSPETLLSLPQAMARRPPAYRATVAAIAARTAVLLGREHDLAALAAFATGTEDYRWETGEPWAGKTALLSHFVGAAPGDVDVVPYFLVRRQVDADSARFLSEANQELAWLLDEDPPSGADGAVVFRDLWARARERAERDDRHLLLVVDGLDEDLSSTKGLPSVASLLPVAAGGRTHVLVASRPYPELPGDVDLDHPLRTAKHVLAASEYAKALEARALKELESLLEPPRREDHVILALAREVVAVLSVARGPLAARDLAELTVCDRFDLNKVLKSYVARILQPIADNDNRRYGFAHDTLAQASERFFEEHGSSQRDREKIDAWADHYASLGWPASDTPTYLFDAYPNLLTTDAKRLGSLYASFSYLEAAITRVGVDRVTVELRAANRLLQPSSSFSSLVRHVEREAHHLRPPYPCQQPGYAARQIALDAIDTADIQLVDQARSYLEGIAAPQLIPQWGTAGSSTALTRTLTGHDGWVRAVAVSADGQLAVSGGGDGTVRVWDLAAGTQRGAPLTGHKGPVFAVALSADGQLAVSGGDDGTVRVWDLAAGTQRGAPLTGHDDSVFAVALSADGQFAVSGGRDGTVRVWDLAAGTQRDAPLTGHNGWVRAVALSADGQFAVSGGDDGTVRVWDLAAGTQCDAPLTGHDGRVLAVAFSVDGQLAISADRDDDGTVRVWDLAAGTQRDTPLDHKRPAWAVWGVALSPDGQLAVSGDVNGTVRIWDLAAGTQRGAPLTGHNHSVRAVALSADGQLAVSGDDDGTVRVWDLAAGTQRDAPLTGHDGRVRAVALSADGQLAVSGDDDGTVRVWDLAAGTQRDAPLTGHDDSVSAVALSADGQLAVSAGDDGTVRVWDLAAGTRRGAPLTGHKGPVWAVALSADGQLAVSGGGDDGTVRVWDLAAGTQRGAPLTGHNRWVHAVALSADGQLAVSAGTDGTVRVWDLAGGTQRGAPLTGHNLSVDAVALSADGQLAVSAGWDGTVRVWDLAAGTQRGEPLTGHNRSVRAVALSADGQLAVSGDIDGMVRVWDLAAAHCLLEVVHGSPVKSIAIAETTGSAFQLVDGLSSGALTSWTLRVATETKPVS